jgi:hypothetical protein
MRFLRQGLRSAWGAYSTGTWKRRQCLLVDTTKLAMDTVGKLAICCHVARTCTLKLCSGTQKATAASLQSKLPRKLVVA